MTITPIKDNTINIDTSEEDTICIYIENKEVIIKHNDVGLSIDLYDLDDERPPKLQEELQYWFTER